MNIKTMLFLLFLLLSSQSLPAKENVKPDFLLKPDSSTSFMNYEFHNLALEAAQKQNYEDAFRLYLKIANKGDDRAEYNVGMMYMKGTGVQRKKMDAYKWLRRAAKHGNQEASLYFKQMNERYDSKHQKAKSPVEKPLNENISLSTPVKQSIEKNESSIIVPIVKKTKVPVKLETKQAQKEPEYLYIIIAFVLLLLAIAFFFFKKSSSAARPDKSSSTAVKNKSQMYDITNSNISKYHNELLKYIDLSSLRGNKKKMQVYYMFLAGVIDYFCQLEKFSDSEQRRIFSTHMTKKEGKENLTAITQAILEGQRNHSMYHYQAAGGVSAQSWYEEKSKDALKMLKKLLTEDRS